MPEVNPPDLVPEIAALRAVRDLLLACDTHSTDLHLVRRDDLFFLLDLVVGGLERKLEALDPFLVPLAA